MSDWEEIDDPEVDYDDMSDAPLDISWICPDCGDVNYGMLDVRREEEVRCIKCKGLYRICIDGDWYFEVLDVIMERATEAKPNRDHPQQMKLGGNDPCSDD